MVRYDQSKENTMFKRYVYIEGLTSLLGSGNKYLINNDGQIKDIRGNKLYKGYRFRLGVSTEPWPTTKLN